MLPSLLLASAAAVPPACLPELSWCAPPGATLARVDASEATLTLPTPVEVDGVRLSGTVQVSLRQHLGGSVVLWDATLRGGHADGALVRGVRTPADAPLHLGPGGVVLPTAGRVIADLDLMRLGVPGHAPAGAVLTVRAAGAEVRTLVVESARGARLDGVEFAPGTARWERGGGLAGPLLGEQRVRGVVLRGELAFGPGPGPLRLTVARDADLSAFGLPVHVQAGVSVEDRFVRGPGPLVVCGVALPLPLRREGFTFELDVQATTPLSVEGWPLVGAVRVAFAYTPAGTCVVRAKSGTLATASIEGVLSLAAGARVELTRDGARTRRSTSAGRAAVDLARVEGEVVVVTEPDAHGVLVDRVDGGTLTAPLRMGPFLLPRGTKLTGLTTPTPTVTLGGRVARAVEDVGGLGRVNVVSLAVLGDRWHLSTQSPVRHAGLTTSELAIPAPTASASPGLAWATTLAPSTRGQVSVPARARVLVCRGAWRAAYVDGDVPPLRVGTFYGAAWVRGAAPPRAPLESEPDLCGDESTSSAWLELSRRCGGRGGVPHEPPPRVWVGLPRTAPPRVMVQPYDLTLATEPKPAQLPVDWTALERRRWPCPPVPCCAP